MAQGVRKISDSPPVEMRCTRNDKDQLQQHSGWKWKAQNMNLAKGKHLDETPVRRVMIDTTLRLKQDKEGIRMI